MDFIIVHSEVIRKDLLQLVNSATKVAIIPHGLYDMFRNKIAVSQDAAKSELGLSASKKIVLFFGSIAERKGASQLLLNMKKILQRDPDITLLMAGVSYYDKGYLENILKQNNIQDSVKIVNKWIPDDQCEYYFAASDVVILPYKDVSTSGILKLAYAFYKPIIATSVGELPEIIEADKSGIIVNFEMSDEDCDNVVALLSSNKRLSEISNDIKNVVETKYSWKMIAIETNKIYESLISGII
jgi:glycosyltransferase involved in cell wall biosynthesis